MKWIVLGVGLATAVLGGWWTWFGLSIVQVERGWSAVIAGSVLVAAGLVIMAIAALMQRVDALSHALSSLRFPASDRAATAVLAADARPRSEPAATPVEQASVESPSATAPAGREADILAAVGAALEFSPAVAKDDAPERQPPQGATETSSGSAPRTSPQRPTVAPAPPAAPSVKPPPSYVKPAPDSRTRSAPPPRFAPTPTGSNAVEPALKQPAPKQEMKPPVEQPVRPTVERLASERLASESLASDRPMAAPQASSLDAERSKEASRELPGEMKSDLKKDLPTQSPGDTPIEEKKAEPLGKPSAPEPRIENARAASETTEAPAVVSPAPPAKEAQPSPMLGPVLSAPQDGDGPKRKPSSFGWLEKARQRDQLRARKADENISDAPPVLSPGAPALDEADLNAPSRAQAPAPAPEPALDAAKPSETDAPARDEADDSERDVPGALADAPVTASGEGAGSRLVRRYDSQGVKYNLYEDGTIEAESESGMYRFGSLAELRAFLEKRA